MRHRSLTRWIVPVNPLPSMSIEFQKNEPELHAQAISFIKKFHAEGLISSRRTVHEMYDQARRFILSTKRDIARAEEHMRRTLQWRKEREIDTLLDDDRKVCLPESENMLARIYPNGFHGVATGNRSVYIERSGCVDRDTLYRDVDLDALELHYARVMELAYQNQWQTVTRILNRKKQLEQERLLRAAAKAKAAAAAAGSEPASAPTPVADAAAAAQNPWSAAPGELVLPSEFIEINSLPLVFVFDLEGLGITDLGSQTIAYFKKIISTMQTHYPHSLYRMFLLNAAFYFEAPWSVMKAFIDPEAAAKIEILGSDFKAKLEIVLPAASSPGFLGGTCRSCPTPDCIPVVWRDDKARLKAANQ